MTTALVDGDIVAYRCAASANKDSEEIAVVRAEGMMRDILEATESNSFRVFLSGSRNFRYDIYPEYKANRRDTPRPVHLQPVREFLVKEWNAEVCDGIEADDALGIAQTDSTTICSIDKDLLQVPGEHYNFVRGTSETITELVGFRNFYKQLILGDKSDNIPGYDGKARIKVPKFLEERYGLLDLLDSPRTMYLHVLDMYLEDALTLTRNARLLYIQRSEGDEWVPPK